MPVTFSRCVTGYKVIKLFLRAKMWILWLLVVLNVRLKIESGVGWRHSKCPVLGDALGLGSESQLYAVFLPSSSPVKPNFGFCQKVLSRIIMSPSGPPGSYQQ